jgi:hypothetical protein
MENANGLIWEVGFSEFFFVTVVLGGGAAYLTGRAVASTWVPNGMLVFYCCLLTLAVRFFHFALFTGTLLSPYYFIVDLIVLLALAFLGRQITRSYQMATQYGFAFQRVGLLGWRERR